MNTLEATIQELGFPTIEEFARFHALDILEHKLEMYEKQLRGYEKKYGIHFQDFEKKSSQIVTYGILEKEDDFMEWESILHSSKTVQKKNLELKSENKVASTIDYRAKIQEYFQHV